MLKKQLKLPVSGSIENDLFRFFGKRSGTYILVMVLAKDIAITVGSLGKLPFTSGYYIYIGSAFGPGGLQARIRRHLKHLKPCRWHIDYLRMFAEIEEIWYTFHPKKLECSWSETIRTTPGAGILYPGLGSSDCPCESHLYFFQRKPESNSFRKKSTTPVFCKRIKG
jgi:Uri superfamily endonuclease